MRDTDTDDSQLRAEPAPPALPAATRLPAPVPGVQAVLPLVIADLQARAAMGAAEHGRPLETHNGRPALLDAYQELLDLVCYLRQALEEAKDRIAWRYRVGARVRMLQDDLGTPHPLPWIITSRHASDHRDHGMRRWYTLVCEPIESRETPYWSCHERQIILWEERP